jgi:hypothetical protein
MASIQIPDSVAAALTAQAQALGLSLDQYLELLAESQTMLNEPRISADELEQLLDAESTAGPAYGGTYSRADIYADHD